MAVLSVAAAIAVPTGAAAQDTHAVDRPIAAGASYVALGDSYAAGYGLGDPTRHPVAACGQSGEDYPHRLAERLDLDLTDVTCAGATTANIVSARQSGAPPQVDALGRATRLVTLTIGGNDANLFGTASSCLALSATGPVVTGRDADTCRSVLVRNRTDTLAAAIDGPIAQGVERALRAVRKAAPRARVVVVGYPAIFPDVANTPAGGCFRSAVDSGSLAGSFPRNAFPFTDVDTAYLNGVQARLDTVTRTAAEDAGATYVSTFLETESRSACATTGSLVSGVTLTATPGLREVDLVAGALHPNRAGTAYLARRVAEVLRARRDS